MGTRVQRIGRAVYSAATGRYARRTARALTRQAIDAGAAMATNAAARLVGRRWIKPKSISGPLTTQRDAQTVSSRRRRRRSDPFLRKFRDAVIREQPTRIYQAVRKARVTSVAGSCAYTALALMDTNTNVDADIWNCFKDAFTAGAIADVEDNQLYFRSAAMTVFLKNSGADEAFVDVYELVAKRDVATALNIADVYVDAFSDLIDIGVTADNWIGITPYDVPEFMRQFRIVKRHALKLEVGASASLSMARKYNSRISGKRLQTATGCLRGITRAYFVIARGPATNNVADSGTAGVTVDCSVMKTIRYALVPNGATSENIGQSK